MKLLYFTATGNNLYIAKRLGGELISIPQAVKNGIYSFKDDKIGIIFPIYGLAVPHYIRDFINKADFQSDYIFAVLSYGMNGGAAVSHLADIAEKCGKKFSYINQIKMVDNFLPGYYMEKQIEGEHKKRIEDKLDMIASDIARSRQYYLKNSFLNKSMTKLLNKLMNFEVGKGISGSFHVEEGCTKCGTCVKVCPAGNIEIIESKVEFSNNCHSCLACTHNCPENVIRVKGEKSKVRFRNQHVSLKEIIEANR